MNIEQGGVPEEAKREVFEPEQSPLEMPKVTISTKVKVPSKGEGQDLQEKDVDIKYDGFEGITITRV